MEPCGAGVGELQNRLRIGEKWRWQAPHHAQLRGARSSRNQACLRSWTWPPRVHIRERPVCEWLISLMQKMRNGKGIACHPFEFVGVPLPILHFQTDAGVKKHQGLSIFFDQTCRLLHASLKAALLSGWFALFSHASMRAFAACLNQTNLEGKEPPFSSNRRSRFLRNSGLDVATVPKTWR